MRSAISALISVASISAILLLTPILFAAESQTGAFPSDPRLYLRKEASKFYNANVARAVTLRAKGDLEGALQAFSAAAIEPISEMPNYELWADMADLYCRLGKKKEGLSLSKEYQCAIGVMAGQKQCWLNAEDSLEIPEKSVLPLCYKTVCNRVYEDQFWQGNRDPRLQPRFNRLRRLAARVEAECK